MSLIIKSDELVIIANRLDKMSRHDLPIAVRSTLNNMAFRMQKTEINKASQKEFDYKRTNIVQNLSWATKAKGFNIARMSSEAGIRERPGRQKVARGLAAQEVGGKIDSRSTPTMRARGGGEGKKVRKANYLKPNKIVDARNKRRNKFVTAAALAKKSNSLLIVSTGKGSAVARVSRFRRKAKGSPNIKLNWLYQLHDEDKRIPQSKTRKFIKRAYKTTMLDFNREFIRQADRRLKKR